MDEYLVNRVLTASPEQLHLMVVEGGLRHARLAAAALADDDYERSHVALDEARKHLSQLLTALNPESTDEFVVNLRSLFKLAFRHFTLGDLDRDVERIEAGIAILAEHRETWRLVMQELTPAA